MSYKIINAIANIKTMISLLALIIIVISTLAMGLNNVVKLIVISGFFAIVIIIILLEYRHKPKLKKNRKWGKNQSYDLFLSAPMASFGNNEQYHALQQNLNSLMPVIKEKCKLSNIFYAGENISNVNNFDNQRDALIKNYQAFTNSKYFVLLYTQKIATSSLIELGWAMAHNKPIIIFTKNREMLPFIIQNADAVFDNIKIYYYENTQYSKYILSILNENTNIFK
jgi:hypothetical protein